VLTAVPSLNFEGIIVVPSAIDAFIGLPEPVLRRYEDQRRILVMAGQLSRELVRQRLILGQGTDFAILQWKVRPSICQGSLRSQGLIFSSEAGHTWHLEMGHRLALLGLPPD
jgi:hypothetical protein